MSFESSVLSQDHVADYSSRLAAMGHDFVRQRGFYTLIGSRRSKHGFVYDPRSLPMIAPSLDGESYRLEN